jgi:uncharacterized protein YdaU (DUF1376 family)
MNFYKHFIGDYGRSTADLSLVEHGAYRLMLDQFYGSGRPLPADKRVLYRLLRAESTTERQAIDAISLRFWRQLPDDFDSLYVWLNLHKDEERTHLRTVAQQWTEAGGLVNIRALGEIVKAQAIAEKNRKIAIDREAGKRAKMAQGRVE